jgi:methyl-accepting chemotaxis protein
LGKFHSGQADGRGDRAQTFGSSHEDETTVFPHKTIGSAVNRLSFTKKFAVIGVVLLLPLGYTSKAYIDVQGAQIAFSAKERDGGEYITPVNSLLSAVVEERRKAVVALSAGQTFTPGGLDEYVGAVEAVDAKFGESFETTDKWNEVKGSLTALSSANFATAKDAFDAYNETTGLVSELVTQAANESNLILDPDLDSFYVMDVVVIQGPALLDALGQLRGLSIMSSSANPKAVGELGNVEIAMAVGVGNVQTRSATIKADLLTTFSQTSDPDVQPALEPLLDKQQDAVANTLALLEQKQPIVAQGSLAAEAISELKEAASPELDRLLETRISGFEKKQLTVEIFGGISFLVAATLFVLLSRWVAREVGQAAQLLRGSSLDLGAVSTQIAGNAEETVAQARAASVTADQVSENVQMIASAVEEMAATAKEVASSASDVTTVVINATGVVDDANSKISQLGESSLQIGHVVQVITSIAEQTNLLALNATIEAARAGEAGKGFAVVANEVKELAKETAKATEEIGQRVAQIQNDSEDAVAAIAGITGIINEIRESQIAIATAVEEQEATTSEITSNVGHAAMGVDEIAQSVRAFAQASEDTSRSTALVFEKADQMTAIASAIQMIVDGTGKGSQENGAVRSAGSGSVSPADRFGAGNGRNDDGSWLRAEEHVNG